LPLSQPITLLPGMAASFQQPTCRYLTAGSIDRMPSAPKDRDAAKLAENLQGDNRGGDA